MGAGQQLKHAGLGALQRQLGRAHCAKVLAVVCGKQRGGHIAGTIGLEGQVRGCDQPCAIGVCCQHLNGAGRCIGAKHTGHQYGAGAHGHDGVHGLECFFQRLHLHACQIAQLELVGCHQIGLGHHALAQQFGDCRVHKAARLGIAHHRVAGVGSVGVGGLHACDGIQNGVGNVGAALVAAEHHIHLRQCAALLHGADDGRHLARRNGRAPPLTVARVVGEVHGVHRPHLMPEALQREHRCRIANVAVGNMGLDGKNVHGSGKKVARHMAGLFNAMGEHGSAAIRATHGRTEKRRAVVRQNKASGLPPKQKRKAKGRARARPVSSSRRGAQLACICFLS